MATGGRVAAVGEVELPALAKTVNELERLLHAAHSQMQRIDCGVSRIRVEPTPASPTPISGANQTQTTLDARLRELTGLADRLVAELGGIAGRLDKFV